MKTKLFISLLFVLTLSHLNAQNDLTIADSSLFDFWIGEWNLTWDNSDGSKSKGTNSIVKSLDGKVIQENFMDEKGFKGTSISVFNPGKLIWHQAWADNQGGYFNFVGEKDGDSRIFKTIPKTVDDKIMVFRMVFYDIKSESMTWDWQHSSDGGQTWDIKWRIFYQRK